MARKVKSAPGAPVTIPSYIVEYFLLGQTRKGAVERYMQDGGTVIDVWLAFAKSIFEPRRVLVAPNDGVRTVDLGYALHKALTTYRLSQAGEAKSGFPADGGSPNVSPLENCVAATIYLNELMHVVLPLTRWWREKNLGARHHVAMERGSNLLAELERSIRIRLGSDDEGSVADVRKQLSESDAENALTEPGENLGHRVIEAAPIVALIGVFCATIKDPNFIRDPVLDPEVRPPTDDFLRWVRKKAPEIAKAAVDEAVRPFNSDIFQSALHVGTQESATDAGLPALIARVFLNREAQLARY